MSLYRLSDDHKGLGMPNSQTSPTDKEADWSSSMSHPKFRLNLDRKPTSASAVTKHIPKVFVCHSIT